MSPLVCLVIAWQSAFALAEPDHAVQAGRQALDRWWTPYPWYDPHTDGIRRIRVSKPWNWDWLWKWLEGWLGQTQQVGPTVAWVRVFRWLVWAFAVAALVAAVYLLLRAYRLYRGRAAEKSDTVDLDGGAADQRRIEALPTLRRRPSDLLAEARRLYQQGNYSEAILYLFSHQLVQLDKHELIRLERGKTNRQYVRELGACDRLCRLVEQTMVAFEDVFFGNHRLDRFRFESCWTRLAEFEALLTEDAG
mgnify:CR=1 FL=1